jgi:DNA polymerase-3 subunit alpha
MAAEVHSAYVRRKHSVEALEPTHGALAEVLEPILDETFGLVVYQEQIMEIAHQLGGFSMSDADLFRLELGRKSPEKLTRQLARFLDEASGRGYPDDAILDLLDVLVLAGDFAFNKSHAVAYGLISYWTAYLKANHPAEFMAALMSAASDDKQKTALYRDECRRLGLAVPE